MPQNMYQQLPIQTMVFDQGQDCLSYNTSTTTHAAIPAIEPQTNGPQFTFFLSTLSCSITNPNKFMVALTTNIKISDSISVTPNKVAIKTIIIELLSAYSNQHKLVNTFIKISSISLK